MINRENLIKIGRAGGNTSNRETPDQIGRVGMSGYAYRSQANPQPPDISESPLQGMVCCQGAHLKEQGIK